MKVLSFTILLFSTIICNAQNQVKIGELYYNLDIGTKTAAVTHTQSIISSYSFSSISIPKSILYNGDNYSVTSIDDGAFFGVNSLSAITLPDGIISIGSSSFANCENLGAIELPQSLKSIGEYAFFNTGMTVIDIPEDVEQIGRSAFFNCTNLNSIKLPKLLSVLEQNLFQGCTNLITVKFPINLTKIEDAVFINCNNLDYVEFPYSLESIGNSAFEDCISLHYLKFPPNVNTIGTEAFQGCSNLERVTFAGNYLTNLGESVFNGCTKLQQIIIPEGISTLNAYSFNNCQSLESINLPNSITTIGKAAFCGCTKLTTIKLPSSLTTIDEGAFMDCANLTNIYFPNSLKSISISCFTRCTSLKTLILPPSLEKLDRSYNRGVTYYLFNGNLNLGADSDCNYYILSNYTPNIISVNDNTTAKFYTLTKQDINGISKSQIFYLLGNYQKLSFDYTGETPNLEISTLGAELYTKLNSANINYTFHSDANINCGEYPIYDISFKYNDFESIVPLGLKYTINPVSLQIIAKSTERVYGENDPCFEYELKGVVNNEDENAIFITTPTVKSNANANSPVGEYQLLAEGAEAKNYSISYVPGSFKITKAPLSLTVIDTTRIYGQSNPDFVFSFQGFKFEDTAETAFSQLPKVNTEATPQSSVGYYVVNATGGVSSNYKITEYNPGALTVTKAPLTLTANNAERNYYTDNPEFDYTLTGLVNNDDRSCITTQPTYSCAASVSSDCGQYIITPSGAFAKNYDIIYKEGMLKILPILLTIIPTDASRYYGDANVNFSFIAEGLKGDDTLENVFTKVPEISTVANESSEVGEYPITISNGKANNYSLAYMPGKLTIQKAPLTVTASDETRIYGQTNPSLKLSYDGFKLGENEQIAFFEKPSATTDANINSDAGVYPISVSGGVSKNYEVTQYIPGNLTITKAPLTLSANNTERLYHSENPEFDFTLTGLVNKDDRTCLSKMPDFACAATLESDCGEYGIIPSNAEAKNYDISYKAGVLKVTKAPLNISVKDCSRKYGDANPRFEFIYSGLKEGEEATSVLSKLPVATCPARANSQVGYYDIDVSGAESANYEITYTPGILTVEKAPLTIRPKNVSRVYGQTNPEFEISYMGFKNNEDESVLFRAPQVTTTASENSPTGQYSITASGASAQNYEIEYEPGILTITKNILKVIVNDASRLYGDENSQFTVRYEGLLNGDTESIVTTKPQFTTEATVKSNAGVYNVTAYGASSPQYDIEYQSGNLTVNPRGISAKVGNYNRPYGTDNPEFVVEYVGLVNGDDKTAITEPSTVTCEADKNSNVGSYAIAVAGGSGQNYEVTSFTNGTLTVEKANQTIDWTQDLNSINQYNQIELTATASSGLPVTYDVASNNVVDIYTSGGKTYLDCYGTGTVTIRATQQGNENYNPSETITNRLTVVSEGGYVDPSTPNVSINVTTAGTLSTKIAESKKYQIKSLTISGTLNGTDIRYIREMAGRDVYGAKTNGILEKLDISRANIVSGGDYYYATDNYSSNRKNTSNNQISDYMFYGCSTLTNLSLPLSTSKIGNYAFDGCINMSYINMPDGILSIGEYAFNGDISLTRISIPGQTTSIGNYAFQNCTGLTTLILSSSVRTIGNGILNGCTNIQEISLNSNNEYFSTLNGVLYNATRTSLIIYPAGKSLQTFEIPDGVTEIRNSGFFGTKALEYLFLPESLISIGTDAFKGCSNLIKLFARPTTPAVCANDCFEAVSKSNCTLYIPRGSYSDYWAAPVWGEFLKIEESNDLSVGGNIAKPDYGFEFPETTLSRGKCTYLPVSMNNVDPVVAFNCDIVLPEGVKLYEDASGQIVFKTSDRFPVSQMIDSRVQTNGDVRIICTSSSNEAFNGTDGILFYIPLFITDPNANQESEYQLTVKNIEFTRKDQSGYHAVESPNINVTLTVSEYSLGDANGDGRITGVDAVIAKGYFLGDNPANFIFKAADMNFDGKISSTDVVLITDEFLSQNQSLMAKTNALFDCHSYLNLVSTTKSSAGISFDVNLPDANRFTAVQMDVTVPEGLNIKNIKVSNENCASHDVRYFRHNNGMTRLFIYSDNNDDFISENLLTIELEGTGYVQGSDKIVVDEVLAVEISGHDYLERSVEGNVSKISDISDIYDIMADNQIEIWSESSMLYIKSESDGVVNIYDMAGRYRPVEIHTGITSIPLAKGVYLINGKKIIIK